VKIYQPKVKEYKTIPLNDRLYELMQILIAERKGEYVLTNNDKPYHYSFFNKQWRIVRETAKLDEAVIPYCLRHTFCTRLVKLGVPVRCMMHYSGHKTLTMAMRYTHTENDLTHLKLLDTIKTVKAAEQA